MSASVGEPAENPVRRDAGGSGPEGARVLVPGSPFGLVAGGGRFPFLVAEGARRRGLRVVGAGIRYQASEELARVCDVFRLFSLGRLGAGLRYLKRHGVREASWAGWIRKEELFRRWRWVRLLPDWRTIRLYFFRVRNRQDHTLLEAVAEEFEAEGIHVTDSTKYCPEILAEEGVLTRRRPSKAQLEDIRFGWRVAKRLADLQVGQSVVVLEKATIAVEAIEGTDRNILRAGELCPRGGFTVVKLAKQGHDPRFDLPAIGPETIETIRRAGGAVLAVEAGRTIVIDREETLAAADRHGIVVVAYREVP